MGHYGRHLVANSGILHAAIGTNRGTIKANTNIGPAIATKVGRFFTE